MHQRKHIPVCFSTVLVWSWKFCNKCSQSSIWSFSFITCWLLDFSFQSVSQFSRISIRTRNVITLNDALAVILIYLLRMFHQIYFLFGYVSFSVVYCFNALNSIGFSSKFLKFSQLQKFPAASYRFTSFSVQSYLIDSKVLRAPLEIHSFQSFPFLDFTH